MRGQRERLGMDDGTNEVSMEELQEFLEGDVLDVPADPKFKERLRQHLWKMLRMRVRKPPSDA